MERTISELHFPAVDMEHPVVVRGMARLIVLQGNLLFILGLTR